MHLELNKKPVEVERDERGRIKKGASLSPDTRFKKGQHWREKKPIYDRDFLFNEYVTKKRSSSEIASDYGITDKAVIFWLKKLEIPTRTISETRAIKHWGQSGDSNPMYGKTGDKNKRWKGGITPDRQAFYSQLPWKKIEKETRERFDNTCHRCKISGGRMEIHHVVSFRHKELRLEPKNLILLCNKCHRYVHSKKNIGLEYILSVAEFIDLFPELNYRIKIRK